MNQQNLPSRLNDIRTWLLFFFLVRLVGIVNAPLEFGHNWRQSLTNMTARNFHENGINLLYPMIDMAGEKTGIIGSEFPFFNALIALMSNVFGYEHWYGRLINLIVSTLGLYFFYKLIRATLNDKIAFASTLLLCVSIWFGFSRKSMPDTFSVSLVIMALYCAFLYLKNGKWMYLLSFFVLASLGILCKIPALTLLSVLVVVPFLPSLATKRKILLLFFACLVVVVVSVWYFVWVPHLVRTYGFELYFTKGISEGWNEIYPLHKEAFKQLYFNAFQSYIAFATVLIGSFVLFLKKYKWLKLVVSFYLLTFILFALKTGAVFPTHSYYVIPLVPLMALLAGLTLERIPYKYGILLLAIISIESIANQQHDFFIKDSEKYKLTLEPLVEKNIPKDTKIIINGGDSPQHIYFSHRKGWTVDSDKIMRNEFVDSLVDLGAKYLIIDKFSFSFKSFVYPEIASNKSYEIYKLDKNKK